MIVCSYNGAATIATCLEALDRQTIRDRIEIIVVDDGSNDGTAAVAQNYDVKLVVHEINKGLSAARNSGIKAARAPIVAFTDDDCIPHQSWIANLLKPYERDEIAGVGGLVSVAHVKTYLHRYLVDNNPLAPLEIELAASSSLVYRLGLYVRGLWKSGDDLSSRAVFSLPGATMSFRKDVLEAVGLMDTRFTFGSDDERICGLVRETFPNMLLWFESGAEVFHDYEGTFQDLFKRNFAYGRGNARHYLLDVGHKWPTIFPIPVAVLVGAILFRRKHPLIRLPLLIQFLLPQGILGVIRHKRISNVGFSYVRLVEETAHDLGLAIGLISGLCGGESRRIPRGNRPHGQDDQSDC